MQEITNKHSKLCRATGTKAQEQKIKLYCCKCRMQEGKRTCEQIETKIRVHEKEISQIDIIKSTRTLGVLMTPMLSCQSQFEKSRCKVVEAMEQLIKTSLTYQQTAIHYNLHMLSSVCDMDVVSRR